MIRLAIFASGNGTNAENIIRHFQEKNVGIEVTVVICNKRQAGVYERAARLGVPVVYVPKEEFKNPLFMDHILSENKIDYIILAGFMLMIPTFLLEKYPERIINIHPSLLPKYGGKGMYGHHVHEAVVAAHEKESGITIHFVNEVCDGGKIIFQGRTLILPDDSAEDVEAKIHGLEKEYFPKVIEETILKK